MSSESYRGFAESFVVETYPDGKLHRYFTQFDMDSDKNDILSTATLTCPYDKTLMAYWEPARMSCKVYGGVFDQETIFSGRVREVEQTGNSIQITLDNIGWKFKQQIDAELVASLVGKPIKQVLYTLFSILKLPYSINLDGIPNINKYTLGDGGSVKFGGEEVSEIPDLWTVIENLGSYTVDELVAKTKATKSTTESAKEYNEKKEILALNSVLNARKYNTPTDLRNNWTLSDNINLKTVKTVTNPNQLEELSELYVKGLDKNSSAYKRVKKEYEKKSKAQTNSNNSNDSDNSSYSGSVETSDSTSNNNSNCKVPSWSYIQTLITQFGPGRGHTTYTGIKKDLTDVGKKHPCKSDDRYKAYRNVIDNYYPKLHLTKRKNLAASMNAVGGTK